MEVQRMFRSESNASMQGKESLPAEVLALLNSKLTPDEDVLSWVGTDPDSQTKLCCFNCFLVNNGFAFLMPCLTIFAPVVAPCIGCVACDETNKMRASYWVLTSEKTLLFESAPYVVLQHVLHQWS